MAENIIKSGFAAILGLPNAGKSTFINAIVGEKVAIVSPKPQTTRNNIIGIYNGGSCQIVFTDTPGIQTPRTKLGGFMAKSVENAKSGVDCVIYVAAANKKKATIDDREAGAITKIVKSKTPAILALNKTDVLTKAEILPEIAKYKDFGFAEIVPLSALKGENVSELIEIVKKYIPDGPAYYPDDIATDQPERALIAEIIRERALYILQDEIPHGVAVVVQSVKYRKKTGPAGAANETVIDIEADIFCEKDSHKGIIIGKDGSALKKIGQTARPSIEALLGGKVNLQLWVKVKKDWRDNDFLLNSFGYSTKKQ